MTPDKNPDTTAQSRSTRQRRARNPKSKLITLQDASTESGVPYSSLRDLVYSGHLERVALPNSRRIYIRRGQLDQLIGAHA